jgi:hypothetical protein
VRPEEKREDSGLNGYREPGEPHDGRNLVIAHRPFWANAGEELAWLFAAEQCRSSRPLKMVSGRDDFLTHLERIATLAGAELAGKPAKEFPAARLPYREDE